MPTILVNPLDETAQRSRHAGAAARHACGQNNRLARHQQTRRQSSSSIIWSGCLRSATAFRKSFAR